MPCYHFTYHGYATWMPDRPRGYVHRTKGLQPRDPHMADRYRNNQRETTKWFGDEQIDVMFDVVREKQEHVNLTVHGMAADATHLHILVSWTSDKSFEKIRAGIMSSVTRALNDRFGKRTWISRNPSRKRVRDFGHFDYLLLEYFPKHLRHWGNPEDRDAALSRKRG